MVATGHRCDVKRSFRGSGRAREAESDAGEEGPTRNAFFLFEAGKRKRLDDLPESSCGNSRCTGGEVAAAASVKTLVAVLASRRSPNAAGYLFRTAGRLPLRELDPGELLNVSAAQAATPEPRPPAFPVRRADPQPERFRSAYRFAPDLPRANGRDVFPAHSAICPFVRRRTPLPGDSGCARRSKRRPPFNANDQGNGSGSGAISAPHLGKRSSAFSASVRLAGMAPAEAAGLNSRAERPGAAETSLNGASAGCSLVTGDRK